MKYFIRFTCDSKGIYIDHVITSMTHINLFEDFLNIVQPKYLYFIYLLGKDMMILIRADMY